MEHELIMKLHNTAIALGIGAATATGLSLLQVNKDFVVGSTQEFIDPTIS